jgi:hypothetical protein
MTLYVIELQPGYWIADWTGDPGRTEVLDSAKVYTSKKAAQNALNKMIRKYDHRDLTGARIVRVKISYEDFQ